MIVGLGNPGREYQGTRHNLGFLVVQALADSFGWGWQPRREFQTEETGGRVDGADVALIRPMTFMNCSGAAVGPFSRYYKIAPENILVVCDDYNLEFGQLRIRRNGSDGGHNGLKSVIEALGSTDFPRLRLGIGRPRGPQDAADYVLARFDRAETVGLGDLIDQAVGCCRAWLREKDIDTVMGQFNKRKEDG